MITHGRGQLCMPILPEVATRLELGPMVDRNTAPHQTPFTVPVDHRSCRTGISAEERARTVRSIIDPNTRPADLVRPGHMFPLVAKEGGVLRRAGHSIRGDDPDLARLADLSARRDPVRDHRRHPDGGPARELHQIGREHWSCPSSPIEGLIKYSPPARKAGGAGRKADLPTRFRTRPDHRLPRCSTSRAARPVGALVMGDLGKSAEGAARPAAFLSSYTGDLLGFSSGATAATNLHMALTMIGDENVGALIYLPQEGRGIGLIEKIRACNLQDSRMDTVEANTTRRLTACDPRDYGIRLQILKRPGALEGPAGLTKNPKKTDAFVYYGYDLQVVDQVPIIALLEVEEPPREYLDAKRDKMGHLLPSGRRAPAGGAGSRHRAWIEPNDKGQGICRPARTPEFHLPRFGSQRPCEEIGWSSGVRPWRPDWPWRMPGGDRRGHTGSGAGARIVGSQSRGCLRQRPIRAGGEILPIA